MATDRHPIFRRARIHTKASARYDRHRALYGAKEAMRRYDRVMTFATEYLDTRSRAGGLPVGTPIVINENTLGYVGHRLTIGILAGDVFNGGADPKNGFIIYVPQCHTVREATHEDFRRFRVDPAGHLSGHAA